MLNSFYYIHSAQKQQYVNVCLDQKAITEENIQSYGLLFQVKIWLVCKKML